MYIPLNLPEPSTTPTVSETPTTATVETTTTGIPPSPVTVAATAAATTIGQPDTTEQPTTFQTHDPEFETTKEELTTLPPPELYY